MASGLPDGTKKFAVDITINPTVNFLGSIAETKIKKTSTDQISSAGDMCSLVPAAGKRIVLLMAVGSSQYITDTFQIQALQSGVWVPIMQHLHGAFYLAFPCWTPTQDVGDGLTARVKIVTYGSGPWSGFLAYFEE